MCNSNVFNDQRAAQINAYKVHQLRPDTIWIKKRRLNCLYSYIPILICRKITNKNFLQHMDERRKWNFRPGKKHCPEIRLCFADAVIAGRFWKPHNAIMDFNLSIYSFGKSGKEGSFSAARYALIG